MLEKSIVSRFMLDRRALLRCATAATVSLAAPGLVTQASAAEELRFAHIFTVEQPFHKWVLWASEQIQEKTSGRYMITVFPASALGGEVDIYRSLSLGTVDMGFTGAPTASRSYGPMGLISGPYVFRDYDHWKRYRDSDAFSQIMEAYNETSGIRAVAAVYYGTRQVTSNKTIREPADMEGLKLRVPNVPLYLLFPRSVGANPAPIAFAELYLALQQKTVDAQENPLPTILAQKFHEVQTNIALTDHMIDTLVALANGAKWNRLSEEDKGIFSATFAEAMARCTEEVRATELQLVTDFATQYGVAVDEVNKEAFRALMTPHLTGPDVPWSAQDYERAQAVA